MATDVFGNEIVEQTEVKKVKKIKKIANVPLEDIGEKISFCRTKDLNPDDYKDFDDKEKFKYGMIFYDFEVFPYDWILTLVDVIHHKETIFVNDRKGLLKFYGEHMNEIHCGYNSRNYDTTIYKSILLNMNPKEVNDKLIVDGLKAFQISDDFKDIQLLDFDIMKLNTGLKTLEAFQGHNIHETDVPFDIPRHLTMEEIEQTISYNRDDVYETCGVFRKRIDIYNANMSIIKMFNFPITYISKTQAQLTAEITSCKKPTESRDDDWDFWIVNTVKLDRYKFIADWFLSLRDDHDRDRIERFDGERFVEYHGKDAKKEGFELHANICGVPHICAMGGIHGCPKEPLFVEKKGQILHSDVNSLYPSIMLEYNLFTRNSQFPEKFRDIYNKRIQYKKEGNPLNKILKIPLNAQYGIMGDKNSSAYDIRNCRMVCITGQLLIITLLEKLEPYINLIQSNTDGIIYTIKNHEEDYDTVMNIIHDWEKSTRLGFATDTIDWIEQGQVNGYAFQFSNGEYERKGQYLKETNDLDNDLPIVNEAMFQYIAHNTDISDFINSCDDLIKFQKVVKISSNYKYGWHNGKIINDKTYRVFASKNMKDTYIGKQKEEGATVEKFANTPEHCVIINENIVGKKCSDYNIDKQWYIDLAMDRLEKQFHLNCKPTIFDMF